MTTGRVAEAPDQDFTLVSSGEPALFSLRLNNAALTETDVDMTIDIAGQAFSIVRKRHPLWS